MVFSVSLHIIIYYEDESCLKNVVIFQLQLSSTEKSDLRIVSGAIVQRRVNVLLMCQCLVSVVTGRQCSFPQSRGQSWETL